MTAQIPSFRKGLPVVIKRWSKTLIIEQTRVRIQYRGLLSDRELPISEFKAVEIAGKVFPPPPNWDAGPGDDESVHVSVKLLHRSDRLKDLPLAEEWFDGSYVTDEEVKPLRKLWADAARSLSLPATDAGVSSGFFQHLRTQFCFIMVCFVLAAIAESC